jgi:glycosyltransferase involved in cell wall biosynthesis
MDKKISIAIPTYNQSQYLETSVLSAYQQTLKPFEIIVYNDCSTDNTSEVLQKMRSEIKELKVVHQEKNRGISINKEACLRACSGDYILLLDSDDKLSPNYCETLVNLLEIYPEAGYAHGNVQEIDENEKKTKIRSLYRKEEYLSPDKDLKRQIRGMKVAANIIIYKKEALKRINYFNCKANFAEDWYMLCELAAAGYGNVFSSKILSSYRVWSDAGKTRQKRKLEEIYGVTLVYNEVLKPTFIKRGWSLKPIEKAITKRAINYSDCLAVNYFSKEEKKKLHQALLQLSNTAYARFIFKIRTNKLNRILVLKEKLVMNSKNVIKSFIKLLNNK